MQQLRQSDDEVWTYDGQDLHADIPRLLKVAGLEDTPDNRKIATKVALTLASEQWPDTPIIVTE